MKKTFKFLGLILAVLFVFIFIACKDDPPKNDPCKCPKGTVHYGEPCDCGGENCSDNCTVKHSVEQTSSGIPIYAGAGVTDEEAKGKKKDIDDVYKDFQPSDQTTFNTRTKKIVIVAGSEASADKAAGVLTVGKDASGLIIVGAFATMMSHVIDNSKETVRMAFAAVNSKGNAKSI